MIEWSSWLNPFDFIILLTLLAGTGLGFLRGVVRMVLSLAVLYIAVVLAMTFYVPVGRWLGYLTSWVLTQNTNQALAFVAIVMIVSGILTFVLSRTYKNTELPGIRHIDQLGGMVFGLILAGVCVGLFLIAFAFVLRTTSGQIQGNPVQANLHYYFSTSRLIPIFYQLMPAMIATLKPWMPKGLTPDILTLRFL
jgi:membrane protein required for colicin V production